MKTSELIYLDNNATTRVDPAVVEEMLPYLTEFYGNPSSGYRFGQVVNKALEKARERVAALLGCEPGEIVFTSCGTESTNAAINSALLMDRDRQHIVTTRVEHSATLKHCEALAKRGHEVTWLGVDERGQIDLHELEKAIRPDTAIVTVLWANNETGAIFPTHEIAEIVRKKHVLFHTDAVQAIGKIPVNLAESKINFLPLRPQTALPEGRRRALCQPPDEIRALPHRRRPGKRKARRHTKRRQHRRARQSLRNRRPKPRTREESGAPVS
jgi:cysteine desulfurase